jgi:hypothetical protein
MLTSGIGSPEISHTARAPSKRRETNSDFKNLYHDFVLMRRWVEGISNPVTLGKLLGVVGQTYSELEVIVRGL